MTRLPALARLKRLAGQFGFELADDELSDIRASFEPAMVSYDRLDHLNEPTLPVRYPRLEAHRADPEDNPLNAWYWKCSIPGASSGSLVGKRVAVKDNICVAGVPMMNGSVLLEGFVPQIDATVVARILDAGGEIIGKAVCENLSFAGNSFTADTGPVRNPVDPSRSAGGSSSGCAALVASGACDMALGCDQGGSIRIPSSMCGIVGLKPTFGLVPYTGIFPIDMTLDHVGPMARRVEHVALLLAAIAGEDGLDPRQRNVQIGDYCGALSESVHGLRIGVLDEGFGWPNLSVPGVDETVRSAVVAFETLGAMVQSLSIPMHRVGIDIHSAIATEGAAALMMGGEATGTSWRGYYNTPLLDIWARSRRARANDMPAHVKRSVLLGQYMREEYHGRYYAKAQNLARALSDAYDRALEHVDLLAMPTVPIIAPPLPEPPVALAETLQLAHGMTVNTRPFNASGHPALSIPCGSVEGLPVGMMLVARYWHEAPLLQAAMAFERLASTATSTVPTDAKAADPD